MAYSQKVAGKIDFVSYMILHPYLGKPYYSLQIMVAVTLVIKVYH